jgi:thiamine biosynthesis protein ThiS
MRLKLNGKERDVENAATVEELIVALGIHRAIVVERNGEIVTSRYFAETKLEEGDTLEILHMVGGG